MENESETKKNKKIHFLPLRVYMMYLFIFTLLFTGVSFSKYVSAGDDDDVARVAAGNVEVDYNDSTAIFLNRPADDGTVAENFNFYVSNTGSEVAIKYDIEVTLDVPLPVGATMYLDGKECFSSGSNNIYLFADAGTFSADEDRMNTHTLTIQADYQQVLGGTDFQSSVYIDILAEQID